MQKQAIEWDLSSISIFKIPVHKVKNAPYEGLVTVACDVNPVSQR